MTNLQSTTRGAMLGISAILAATILFVPRPGRAEVNPVSLVEKGAAEIKKSSKSPDKRMALGLDDDGNVKIRYGGTSLTLIYGPEGTASEIKERLGLAPPLKGSAGMGEVSFKVGFAF